MTVVIPGLNKVRRNSNESAVTSEGSTSHNELINGAESGPEVLVDHSYCSCGWPEYSLVPRGSRKGMDFVLFAMLTDYEEDREEELSAPYHNPEHRSMAARYQMLSDNEA
ncbi:hemocyanin F chain [Trichonephila inaurata madagascariensis]|uniref:Hemocyanin F chain n=1 Tax=Trichonephila inaurata madagascariensis TaxID=2747483 RepID=A0A8X7C9X2_9ARAC|nr:hemocyanin F chain [Trichonephila inaurata madagascariensis]